VRLGALLLVSVVLVAGAVMEAPAAPPAPNPSVFDERGPSKAPGGQSDPALRQRFLSEYRSTPPEGRRKVFEAWIPKLGVAGLAVVVTQTLDPEHPVVDHMVIVAVGC
jgi:hypothetical protein